MIRSVVVMCAALGIGAAAGATNWNDAHAANPFLPGYFADPSIIEHEGRHYLYATIDPWGGERLACWVSDDFRDWTYHELNWPTKTACASAESSDAMVWAPSVVRGVDGRFYQYTSVGSEIWVGVAEHPLGPWSNALGDRPLVPRSFAPDYHMIDADVFIDDDNRAYLYWGSGWNWVNGACFAVELEPDMVTFRGEPKVVTPTNYFEGPTMLKHGGRYYLTYSSGKTTSDTYQVHYAIGKSPLGPFEEAPNSPILVTDHDRQVVSPGHHGFVRLGSAVYIAYHRHRVPFIEGTAYRQICLDQLRFDNDGLIQKIVPTHEGPAVIQRSAMPAPSTKSPPRVTASGQASAETPPDAVFDNNYATRWVAETGSAAAWLQLDLGDVLEISESELRLEYPNRNYPLQLRTSKDGVTWSTPFRTFEEPTQGSPARIEHATSARYLRIDFAASGEEPVGVWEWRVR